MHQQPDPEQLPVGLPNICPVRRLKLYLVKLETDTNIVRKGLAVQLMNTILITPPAQGGPEGSVRLLLTKNPACSFQLPLPSTPYII